MERNEYLAHVKKRMPEKRYIHTIGVMETAISLAKKYGEDEKAAETAAILHDICKYADENWMIQIVKEHHLDQRLISWGPELLHGPVGAWVAEHEFHIENVDILNAIRYHTTGRKNMSTLEKIIYIADMIEPNRRFDGVDQLRTIVQNDLEEGMKACIRHSIKHLIESELPIFPESIECYNDYFQSS